MKIKKILVLSLAAILVLTMFACGKKDGELGGDQVANPIVEYESLDKLNKVLGTELKGPAVMGKEDVSFTMIGDTVAQYVFQVNGMEYCLRAGLNDGTDISGYYVNGNTVYSGEATEGAIAYITTDGAKFARWAKGKFQYILMTGDSQISDELFETCAVEISSDM